MNTMRRAIFFVIIGVLVFPLFALRAESQGAALYVHPSLSSYAIGSTISLDIKVNTGGQAINAAQGVLAFDLNAFEVAGLSKSGSIFTLWTQDPVVSRNEGTVEFGGGLPNPGFTGSNGKLFTISMKVKATGTGGVNWLSGAVLANDGQGTNILTSMTGGLYTLNPLITAPKANIPAEKIALPEAPSATPKGVPAAPIVVSPTHPEENKWYQENDVRFEWKLPSDATGVSLLMTEAPSSNPGFGSDGLINSYEFRNVADGVYYLHIKFRNRNGWGEIAHRKIMIDTEPPQKFQVQVENQNDPTDPAPPIHFRALDALSGISYYEARDGADYKEQIASDTSEKDSYISFLAASGKHTVIVEAFDRAGNSTISTADFTIKAIDAPSITEYPSTLIVGETLRVAGKFDAEGLVRVFSQKEGEDPTKLEVKADKDGNWAYVHDRSLEKGVYRIWTEGVDARGAQSYPSDKIHIAVKLPTLFRIGKLAIDYLSIMVSLLAIIGLVAVATIFGWYRIMIWKKKLHREVREAEESVHKAFGALSDELRDQLETFDKVKNKRELTNEEKKMIRQFKAALDVAEQYIGKEIRDVEKELE